MARQFLLLTIVTTMLNIGQRTSGRIVGLLLALLVGFLPVASRGQDQGVTGQTNAAPTTSPFGPGPFTQPVFQPLPAAGFTGTPPGSRLAGTSQLAVQAPPLQGVPMQPPFQLGPVQFYPHLAYELSYGNNLEPLPGQQVNTLVNQLSPGIMLRLGIHWTLDYTPTLVYYSSRQFQDAVNQAVSLNGGTTYEDWTLGLSQSYSSTSEPMIETASQLNQEVFATGLSAMHQLGSRLSIALAANQNFRYIDNVIPSEELPDVREWSTMDWLDYQFWPAFSAGVGAGFTYDNMSVGPDMTSEQYQGRINYKAGTKLTFVLSGGLNDMQFLNSPVPDLVSPIFSLAANYQIFETTTLSLGASRAVTPAYFENAVVENTGINAGVHQRLLGKLFLNVGGGYATSTYHNSAVGPVSALAGNYDSTSLNVSLSTRFLKRASASVFYQTSYLSSGVAAFNYTINEVGMTLAYQF